MRKEKFYIVFVILVLASQPRMTMAMGPVNFEQRLNAISIKIKNNPDSCLQIYNGLYTQYRAENDAVAMAATLSYIGDVYANKSDPETAIKKYIEAKELISRTKNIEWNLWIREQLSMLFSNNQNFAQARSLLADCKKYLVNKTNDTLYAEWCYSLAALYNHKYFNAFDSSLYYFGIAEKIYLTHQLWDEVGSVYNMMGEVCDQKHDYKNSLIYHEKAIEYHKKAKNHKGVVTATKNLGDLYYYLKDNQKALDYYLSAYQMEKDSGASTENLAIYSTDVAYMYGLLKDKKKLREFYAISLDYAAKAKRPYVYEYIYQWYSGIFEIVGDYPLALKTHKLWMQAKDSVMQQMGIDDLAKMENELTHKHQLDLQQKEKEMAEAREQQQKIIRNIFIVGFSLCLILLFAVFKNYREKKRANVVIQKQKQEVELQKEAIELKNKEITDSINYAKRIQEAILPGENQLNDALKEHFVLYMPKDIVSGDIYWVKQVDEQSLFAAIDCTGHGVPGALMSILARNGIDKSVGEMNMVEPDQILTTLDKYIQNSLQKGIHGASVNDGMDMALCCIDRKNNILMFSGAMNPLCVVRNRNAIFIKGDRYPIGGPVTEEEKTFTKHELKLEHGDMVYLFSDGYHDQFGGREGKKLKLKNLKDMLCSIASFPVNDQKQKLKEHINNWKGNHEQVDDILVIGVKV